MDLTRKDAAQKCIKVMVYEATEMAGQLLCHELERSPYGFEVAGYSTSSIAEPNSPVYSADIALISADLHEGPNSGFKLLQDIRQSTDRVRCVMLLDRFNRDVVVGAFSSGALGICSRRESCETLCKCLDRVHHGQIWANSEQLRYVLEALWAGARVRLTDARGNVLLTKREEEIVFLVAEGLKNREVAERLKVTENTVRNHLFRVFEKLGISSRAELILYFLQQQRNAASA